MAGTLLPTNSQGLKTATARTFYSFPKAQRFSDFKLKHTTDNFYDIRRPDTVRAPSFGYGSRYDFGKQCKNSPPPNIYKLPSAFDFSPHKSISFGISREQAKRAIEGHFQADPSIPGPGRYDFKARIGEGLKFSFGERTPYEIKRENSPGPGAYRQSIEKTPGDYLLSNCKSARLVSFSPTQLPRFNNKKDNAVPGPGTYPVKQEDIRGGRFSAMSSQRFKANKVHPTPGPGAYRIPGEFRLPNESKI